MLANNTQWNGLLTTLVEPTGFKSNLDTFCYNNLCSISMLWNLVCFTFLKDISALNISFFLNFISNNLAHVAMANNIVQVGATDISLIDMQFYIFNNQS